MVLSDLSFPMVMLNLDNVSPENPYSPVPVYLTYFWLIKP